MIRKLLSKVFCIPGRTSPVSRRISSPSRSALRRLAVEPLETRRLLAATGSISGFAFLDPTNSGQMGAGTPGYAGMTVELHTVGSQGTLSGDGYAQTQADGSYSFSNLAAGTYEVQIQPSAKIDVGTITPGTAGGTAGTNDIQLTLADAQAATGNNFDIVGVQSGYVSNRMFLASTGTFAQFITTLDTPPTVNLGSTSTSYTTGTAAVAIASGATIAQGDSPTLTSMTVSIENATDGASEVLAATASNPDLTQSYAGGVLTISGVANLPTYQSVLQSVTYSDNSSSATVGNRTISVVVNDGTTTSAAATTTVAVVQGTEPSGYTIAADQSTINAAHAAATGFTFSGAEIGATYNYSITSSGGGTAITGSGTVTSSTQDVTGIDVSSLTDGTVTFSVTLTSSTGTGSPATATATLDTTPPTGYTISADNADIGTPTAANTGFTFSGAEVGDTYNYSVASTGGGTPVSGSGTVTSATQDVTGVNVSALGDGTLTFSATLTDPAGNAGAATTASATLSRTAPTGYSIAADQSSVNASGDANVGFTFTGATVGDTYQFTIASSGGSGTATGSGTVSSAGQDVTGINVSSLPDGTLTDSVTLTDQFGNVGTAATATFTLDKTAPSGYTISLVKADVNAATGADAGFTFANAGVGDTYQFSVSSSGGGTPVTGSGTVTSASQTISGINVTTLSDGNLTYSVTLTDTAGNTGSPATANGVLDRVAPSGYTITATPSSIGATASTHAGFTFASAEVGDTYNFTVSSSAGTGTVTGSGTVTAANETVSNANVSTLADGTLTYSVTLTDPSGNMGSATTANATLDTVPPSGYSIVTDQSVINAAEAASTGIQFSNAVVGTTYQITVTSTGGAGSATASGTVTSASENVTGISVTSLHDGTLTYSVTLTDSFGNVGTAATAMATLDATPPSGYTISPVKAALNASAAANAGFIFADAEVGDTYNYTISSSGGGTPITGSGTVTSASETVSGIDVTSLSDGNLTYSVTLTDSVGNVGAVATANGVLDRVAPSGYTISPKTSLINVATASNTGFTFSNAEVGDTFDYTITSSGGSGSVTGSGTVTSAAQQVTGVNVTALPNGTVTFSVTLTDPAGNVGNAATTTATLDTSVPSGYTISADNATIDASQSTSTGFTFAGATTGDTYQFSVVSASGGGSVTGSGTITSSSQDIAGINVHGLPDGTLTFSAKLTNPDGNVGAAATATATLATAAPSGYTITADKALLGQISAGASGFTFKNATTGTTYDFTVTSNGGSGTVTGSGSVTSPTQDVTGIDVSALPDGTLTYSVTLTNVFGDVGAAALATATLNRTVPSGYTISADSSVIDAAEKTNAGFTFSNAVVGDTYNFLVTTSGPNEVIGSGTITSASQNINGIDLTTLPDGTVTYSVTLTNSFGNVGQPATATSTLDTAVPSGYTITLNAAIYGKANADIAGFSFSNAIVGDTYNYTVTSTGGGTPLTGSGTVTSATQAVTVNLVPTDSNGNALPTVNNGTLTWSVTLTDAVGNVGQPATATVTLNTKAPPAFTVTPDENPVTDPTNFGFQVGNAELGDTLTWDFIYQGDPTPVRGSATITSATMNLTGLNISQLPSAAYLLHVVLTDPANNGTAENADVTVDKPIPAFTISPASAYVNASSESDTGFTFANAETLTTYKVTVTSSGGAGSVTQSGSVDSATQSVGGIDVTGLADGTLTFSVVLTDQEGNVSSPVTTTAILDTVAPSGYAISANQPVIDLATRTNAGFTFSGAEVGDTFDYSVASSGGSGTVSGSGTITAAGQSVTGINVSTLADGTLTYSVNLTDPAGNQGATVTANAALDTVVPSGYTIAADSPYVNAADNANAGFTFAAATTGDTYHFSVTSSGGGGTVTGSGTVTSASENVSGINVSGLPDGTLTYSVTLTDTGGNTGTAATATATLDTVAPSGFSVAPLATVVTSATVDSTGFVFSNAEVGATYQFSITSTGSGLPVTGSGTISAAGETISGINLSGLGDGTLTFSVTLTDPAGNTGAVPAATATLDRSAPFGYAIAADPSSINGSDVADAGFDLTGGATGDTYNVTVTSSGGGGSVTASGTLTAAAQTISGIDVSTLPDGTLTFSVSLTASGHTGAAVTASATLQVTAPSGFSVTPDESTINASAVSSTSFTLGGAGVGDTYNFTISGTGGGTVTGSGAVTAATQDITGIDLSSLPEGAITFSVTLTDPAGNTSNPVVADATIDTSAPASIALSTSSATSTPSTTVGILGTSGGQPSSSYTYSLVSGEGSNDNGSFTISGDVLATGPAFDGSQGTYSIRVQSTDAQGDSIQQQFTITVSGSDPIGATLTFDDGTTFTSVPVGGSGTFSGAVADLEAGGAIIGNQINYTLVSGTDSTDNSSFQIVGNQLQTSGPLAPGTYSVRVRSSSTFLLSDVVDLSGVNGPYAFQVSLDPTVLPSTTYTQVAANAGLIGMSTDGAGTGNWVPAVAANKSVPGSLAQTNYQGSFASFWAAVQAANPSATVADIVGSSGVDLTNNEAWAVVDQPGEYAVADTVFTEQVFTITVA